MKGVVPEAFGSDQGSEICGSMRVLLEFILRAYTAEYTVEKRKWVSTRHNTDQKDSTPKSKRSLPLAWCS